MGRLIPLLLLLGIANVAHADELRVSQRFHSNAGEDGVDGELRLLVDARLSDRKLEEEKDFELDDDPIFKNALAVPAQIMIVSQDGKVIRHQGLEKAIASMRQLIFSGSYKVFAVSVNNEAGFGSYSGVGTQLLRVEHGALQWVKAKDALTGKSELIRLGSTLKQEWKMADSNGSSSRDIFDISCHPPFQISEKWDGTYFSVDYRTYHLGPKGWETTVVTRRGYWEAEQPFPPAIRFPRIGGKHAG